MTIKELITELSKFDDNLTVIVEGSEENSSPSPRLQNESFDMSYWDDNMKIAKIKSNTDFVSI